MEFFLFLESKCSNNVFIKITPTERNVTFQNIIDRFTEIIHQTHDESFDPSIFKLYMEDFTFPLRSKITEITDLSTSIFNYSSLRFDLILSQSFPTTPEFEEPEVDPNNKKQMFDDAISQTIIAINNKDSKTASLNIQKALKLDPRSPIPYQLQVRLHFKFHRFKSAVEVALNAYRHFPNDYTCLSLLGKAKQRVGAHNEAIEYFKRLLLIPRNRPLDFESINHSIAKSLFMLGKLDESYTLIYPIYKSNHSNLKASVLLAQIYAEKGLLRDALHIIIKNFSIDPDHKQSCRFIGNHIINDRQAIVLAEELGDGMKNPHILFYVGNILYTHGSCKVADYFFRRALKILPFDPAIFVGTFRNFISLRLGIEQCNEMINLLMDYLRQQNDELSTITQDNDNGNNDSNYVEQKGTLECPFKLVQLDSIWSLILIETYLFSNGQIERCRSISTKLQKIIGKYDFSKTVLNDEIILHEYIYSLIQSIETPINKTSKKIYVIGDEHSLTMAYRTITYKDEKYIFEPVLIEHLHPTDLVSKNTSWIQFSYSKAIDEIPNDSLIVFAGCEIDCSEWLITFNDQTEIRTLDEVLQIQIESLINVINDLRKKKNFMIWIHPMYYMPIGRLEIVTSFNRKIQQCLNEDDKNIQFLDILDKMTIQVDGEEKIAEEFSSDGVFLLPNYLRLIEEEINSKCFDK